MHACCFLGAGERTQGGGWVQHRPDNGQEDQAHGDEDAQAQHHRHEIVQKQSRATGARPDHAQQGGQDGAHSWGWGGEKQEEVYFTSFFPHLLFSRSPSLLSRLDFFPLECLLSSSFPRFLLSSPFYPLPQGCRVDFPFLPRMSSPPKRWQVAFLDFSFSHKHPSLPPSTPLRIGR